jgi:hypothetical protein
MLTWKAMEMSATYLAVSAKFLTTIALLLYFHGSDIYCALAWRNPYAQSDHATLNGTVKDVSPAVVSGEQVRVENTSTIDVTTIRDRTGEKELRHTCPMRGPHRGSISSTLYRRNLIGRP